MIEKNKLLGINSFNVEQGSEDWYRLRLGCITASKAHLILMDDITPPMPDDVEIETIKRGVNRVEFNGEAFVGKKADCIAWYRNQLPKQWPEGKTAYLNELVGQVCTGLIPEQSNFKQADWGHMNEELARDAYEARNFSIITQAGLIYKDESLRCAISPDGLDLDAKKGLEIKSPYTTQVHIDTILNGKIKPEYRSQCQFSIWVTDFDVWDFCSYDNRMRGDPKNRLHIIPIERDEKTMKKLDEKVPEFINKLDEALARLGFRFGDQWVKADV